MDDFLKIPKEAIAKTFGLVHGRWTGKVFFEKQLILDTYAMFPYMVESDPVTL